MPASIETTSSDEEEPDSYPSSTRNSFPPDTQAFWKSFLKIFEKNESFLAVFLAQAKAELTDDSCIVTFANDAAFQYQQISKKDHVDKVRNSFSAFAGRAIKLELLLDKTATTESPVHEEAVAVVQKTRRANRYDLEADIEKEPVIKVVFEQFDGELME